MTVDRLLPLRDKATLAAWTARVLAAGPRRVAAHGGRSAAADLAAAGVRGPVLDRVLRPFLSGVLGEAELTTSAAFVRLVWRAFALGTIAVPDAGMGALAGAARRRAAGRRAAAGPPGGRRPQPGPCGWTATSSRRAPSSSRRTR